MVNGDLGLVQLVTQHDHAGDQQTSTEHRIYGVCGDDEHYSTLPSIPASETQSKNINNIINQLYLYSIFHTCSLKAGLKCRALGKEKGKLTVKTRRNTQCSGTCRYRHRGRRTHCLRQGLCRQSCLHTCRGRKICCHLNCPHRNQSCSSTYGHQALHQEHLYTYLFIQPANHTAAVQCINHADVVPEWPDWFKQTERLCNSGNPSVQLW